MRKKSKHQWYVFSIYSSVLQNYPYYPFIAKTINDGIHKFVKFISYKESVCEGAELHVIGTCDVFPDTVEPQNICPYIVPKRVEIKDNFIGKLFVLVDVQLVNLERYLDNLKERRDATRKRTEKGN